MSYIYSRTLYTYLLLMHIFIFAYRQIYGDNIVTKHCPFREKWQLINKLYMLQELNILPHRIYVCVSFGSMQ
jgi:hypothetical protein